MSNIGTRLQEARKRRGLTQKALANSISRCTSAISGYENNEQVPPVDILISLARILNVSLDYLTGLNPEQTYAIHSLTPEQQEIIDALFKEFTSSLPKGDGLSSAQTDIIQKLLVLFASKNNT